LREDGWYELRTREVTSSFSTAPKRPRDGPHPVRDIPSGRFRSIEKQAGIRLSKMDYIAYLHKDRKSILA